MFFRKFFKKKKKSYENLNNNNFYMTPEIRELLLSKDYKFLTEDPRLGNNIILLTIGGSRAYGTNTPTSDWDIRGIAVEDADQLLGYTQNKFEQYIDNKTDTVIYGFNKYIKMLMECNPNILEIVGSNRFIYISPLGEKIIQNLDKFITSRVGAKFAGYANAQLAKIRNAMYGDALSEEEKKSQELNAIKNAMSTFNEHYKHYKRFKKKQPITIYQKEDRLYANVLLKNFPLEEFKGMIKEIKNVCDDYDKIGNRNTKIDDAHMCKHMMHLVRLYHMGIEMLETGKINVYREKDHDELMAIRNGKYMKDHIATPEFFDMVADLEAKFKVAKSNTKLPKEIYPDEINEFLLYANQRIVNNECYDENCSGYLFEEYIDMLKNDDIYNIILKNSQRKEEERCQKK